MATAAFLLAPVTPIPRESDGEWESRYCSWNYLAEVAWEELREKIPAGERRLAQNAFSAGRTTSNFASLGHLKDPAIRRSARKWVKESYGRWVAEGRRGAPPTNSPAEFSAATGIESGISIGDLIHYRGGFKKLAARSLRPGVEHGYLGNKGKIDEFSLGSGSDIELTVFAEIARAHGGEHIAIWTYGQAVHVWHARSGNPGTVPRILRASFRIHPPEAHRRDAQPFDRLRSGVEGSVFEPDWDGLRSQLNGAEVSVASWFEAFGIPGANELVPEDREAVWEQFGQVALDLLGGGEVDRAAVRRLNQVLAIIDAGARLPVRPVAKALATARRVAESADVLAEAIGDSRKECWKERRRAARSYWDITDGPAGELLTVGVDRKRSGDSASLGRLLGHYPAHLLRDPIFLALAALEVEGANGHAFVEPLLSLSEQAVAAGFLLVVYPAECDREFCKAFGIQRGVDLPGDSHWAAQAFVQPQGLVKLDLRKAVEDWFAGSQENGHLLYAHGDGTWDSTEYRRGEPRESSLRVDRPELRQAARELNVRQALQAIGLPDLLAPGAWTEGSYAGVSAPGSDPQRAIAAAASEPSGSPLEVGTIDEALREWRPVLRYRGDKDHWEDGIISLRLLPAAPEPGYLDRLRRDLCSDGLVNGYGDAWIGNGAILAYTRTSLDLCLLDAVVADMRPVHVVVDLADEGRLEFRLT